METFSASLAMCAGNSPATGEIPAQRPVTRSFDVFFDLRLNKRLSKQSWGWWCETPSHPLWRHCDDFGATFAWRNGKVWWLPQMETFSAFLALFEGNPQVTGGIPYTKASDAGLLYFLWSVPEQTIEQTIGMPVIWDAFRLIMTSA